MIASSRNLSRAAIGCPWCFLAVSVILLTWLGCASQGPVDARFEATFDTKPPTTVLAERNGTAWVVRNGQERIVLPEIAPGVHEVPVFGGSWVGEWHRDVWEGVWTDSLRPGDYRVPLRLRRLGSQHAIAPPRRQTSTWQTTEGILHLEHAGDSAWATISTPTGDYRYLSGLIRDNILNINTFDGAHLFHFEAEFVGDSLKNGLFLSGTHYRTTFAGARLHTGLPAWSSGQQRPLDVPLRFEGRNAQGDLVTLTEDDVVAAGKRGVVVDVMGTWCPNCMDEARLLAELAPNHPDVLFLSLAFERSEDEVALARISKFKETLHLPWEVWLAGPANKRIASERVGVIDTVRSFPTTVFWPVGEEAVIHTGFNGPATGEGYAEERRFFERQLQRISGRSESR